MKKRDVKRVEHEGQSLILSRMKYCIGSESPPPQKLLLFDQRAKKINYSYSHTPGFVFASPRTRFVLLC